MKKGKLLCAALIAVCLLAGQAAVAAGEFGGNGPAGLWKLIGVEAADGTYSEEEVQEMESLGSTMYLDLYDDYTAKVNYFGQEMDGSWDDNYLYFNEMGVPYILEGDLLSLQNGDEILRMSRTNKEEIDRILGYETGVLDENVEYTWEEQPILECEAGSVTITGYEVDPQGLHVKVRCTNTWDHQIVFSTKYGVVNRYEIDPGWAQAADPGVSVESEILFPVKELKRGGITAADELILNLQASDFTTWEMLADNVVATVYPTGKTAADIVPAPRETADTDVTAVENEACSFVVLGYELDAAMGCLIHYYYENRTDRTVSFNCDHCKVNGREVPIYGVSEVPAGCRGFGTASVPKSDLEENRINGIDAIQFTVTVYDAEGEAAQMLANGTVTLP